MLARIVSRRQLVKAGYGALLLLLGAAVFRYPAAVVTGASRGLSLCGTVIIPSLLPFLVLTGTFLRSSLCGTAGRWLRRPTAVLFRLPGSCAAAVFISMLGGYPAGAAATRDLLERREITPQQAARLMHFCVNAGPAFAVSAVGSNMLGNARSGWILLAAQLTAAVIIGFAEARSCKGGDRAPAAPATPLPPAAAFTAAVNSACAALLTMCGFVILFCVLLSLADGSGFTALFDRLFASAGTKLPSLLPGLLEVSCGCLEIAGTAPPSYFLLGFFMSFGGLSVQCQARALLQEYPAACRYFFVYRLLHGLLSGLLSALLFSIIPQPAAVLAPGTAQLQLYTATPAVSLAMLAMCAAFLMRKRVDKSQ